MKKKKLINIPYVCLRSCLVFGSLGARKQQSQLLFSAAALVVPKRGKKNKIFRAPHKINPSFITGFSAG